MRAGRIELALQLRVEQSATPVALTRVMLSFDMPVGFRQSLLPGEQSVVVTAASSVAGPNPMGSELEYLAPRQRCWRTFDSFLAILVLHM